MANERPKVEILPRAVFHDDSYLPQFPALAGMFDHHARRIPWWAWIGVGWAVGSGFLGRLFNKVKPS